MITELSRDLAIAKQHFEELTSLTTIDSLARGNYETGAKWERIQELLEKIIILLPDIKEVFFLQLDKSDTPIMQISANLKEFYTVELEPNANKLFDIWVDIKGLKELMVLLSKELNQPHRERPIAKAMDAALDRWVNVLTDGELKEWLEEGFSIETAGNFLDKAFFAPDLWLENSRLLSRPILLGRHQRNSNVPLHIKTRLTEIYRAFIYGLWMSAIALSRSVAEYAIINNAGRFDIDPIDERKGRNYSKPFGRLIDEIAEIRPELRDPLETVQDAGNRTLHPKKKSGNKILLLPKAMRNEALECVIQTRFVVENLYTHTG
jgi:hypothetical protein